jgi:hypothetical protein
MFLYHVLEQLRACADGHFCLKVGSVPRSESSFFPYEQLTNPDLVSGL